MKRETKILGAIVLVLAIGFGAWATTMHRGGGKTRALPVISTLPDFKLTDQEGRTVTRASLHGHPLILDFIFTSCTEFCSAMTNGLTHVRAGLGPDTDVRIVSISVDPENDTPQVLRKFAVAHQANDPRWLFLTGDKKTIGRILQGLFLMPSGDPGNLNPAMHSPRLILVDPDGRVRGYYEHEDPQKPDLEARKRLIDDAKSLERK
jgi:protein SCO1/2